MGSGTRKGNTLGNLRASKIIERGILRKFVDKQNYRKEKWRTGNRIPSIGIKLLEVTHGVARMSYWNNPP